MPKWVVRQFSVIRVGSFTLWPMSYYDNRVSFGMVVYGPCGCPVRVVETPVRNGSVTVWGQADQRVTLSPDDVGGILVPES